MFTVSILKFKQSVFPWSNSSKSADDMANSVDLDARYDMGLVVRKPVFGFPTRSHTNQTVQPHKMAGGLKFRI